MVSALLVRLDLDFQLNFFVNKRPSWLNPPEVGERDQALSLMYTIVSQATLCIQFALDCVTLESVKK